MIFAAVTGGRDCSRSQGFWRHQFSDLGRNHFTVVTLQTCLDLVDFASGVFSELAELWPGLRYRQR